MKTLDDNFFKKELAELMQVYGANKFTGRIINLIYESVKYLTPRQFEKVVNDIIMDGGYFPAPKVFRQKAEPFLKENRDAEKKEQSASYRNLFTNDQYRIVAQAISQGMDGNAMAMKMVINKIPKLTTYKCNHCLDNGYLLARPLFSNDAPSCFNCFCDKKTNNAWPQWGTRWMDRFENLNTRNLNKNKENLCQ